MDKNKVISTSEFPLYALSNKEKLQIDGCQIVDITTQYEPTNHPHQHTFWECMFLINGAGEHTIDFQTTNLKPNTFTIIKPNQHHQIKPTQPLKGCFIMFNENFLLSMFSSPHTMKLLSSFTQKPIPLCSQIKTNLTLLKHYFKSTTPFKADLISAQLKIILLLLEQSCKNKITNQFSAIVKQFFYELNCTNSKHRFVQHIAKKCFVSTNYLNECVKNQTGKNAKHWLKHYTILEAKRLLNYTNMNINTIALQLHFSDTANFCQFFKKETGLSPLKWKQLHHNQK